MKSVSNKAEEINPEILNLFGLIGMLPGGVSKDELTELWQDDTWETLKEELISASLITYKTFTDGSTTYKMLPFMSMRAYEHLETNQALKQDYHMRCWKLFKQYWFEFYQAIVQNTVTLQMKKDLLNIETNIWAWIYRALNRVKRIEYNDPKQQKESKHFNTIKDNHISEESSIDSRSSFVSENTLRSIIYESEDTSSEVNDYQINKNESKVLWMTKSTLYSPI